MTDIPLRETQIVWDPDETGLPPVKLVRAKREDDPRYSSSWGACNLDFAQTTDEERINMLFHQFVHMTVVDDIAPKALHEIFMDIPEYRRALAEFGSIQPSAQTER